MKVSKLIVFLLVAVLLATFIIDVNPARAANPDTTAWIPDQKVSADAAQSEIHPSIATAGDGSLWVAYEHWNTVYSKYEIVVVKSTDGGVTWSVMYTKTLSGYNLYNPSIAIDPYYNYVYVVYERMWSTSDYDIFLLRYNGTGWYDEYVTNDFNDDHSPSIACEYEYGASNNFVFLTWERRVNAQDIEIMFARSTNKGDTWTVSALTSHGTGEVTDKPSMAYQNGTAGHYLYIAYRDNDQIEGLYRIALLRSTNEGGSFGAPIAITPYNTPVVREPSITAVHGGTVVMATWVYPWTTSDDDIYYSYSTNSGTTWASVGSLASSSLNEINPHLTVDGMGMSTNYMGYIHAVYEKIETSGSRTNGIDYRKAYYTTPTSWSTAVQIADDNAYVSYSYPNVADRPITTVHTNVPVVVWTDLRNPTYDIYGTTLGGKYTINTHPTGLQVSVDGTLYTAPQSFYWAYESVHTLSVSSPQGNYPFVGWSDGGAQSHSFTAYTTGETTVTARFNEPAYLVVRGESNQIFYRTYSALTSTWGGWTELPGQTNDPPAAAYIGGELHIVVRGVSNNALWHGYVNLNTNAFSGWTLLSGATPSSPTMTANSTHICLVVRGLDSQIWYRFYTLSTRTWGGWAVLPGGTTADTPAAVLIDNKLQIVVRGSSANQIWYGNLDLASNTFSGWTLLDGATPSPPVLTSISNYLCLVVRGNNNNIYYRYCSLPSGTWGSWSLLPAGSTPDAPAATITGDTYLQIVVRGMNADAIWHGYLNCWTATWSGWTLLSGATPSGPTLTS